MSAVIIACDEEATIERCLRSLSFCSEIVVVDSGSNDRTGEIARRYCTRFEVKQWAGFSAQKNYANALASEDWILSLDADEEVTVELREEIETLEAPTDGTVAFSLARRTYYGGRWVKHGGWYPNRVVRLFNRKSGQWVDVPVHEYWQADGKVGSLETDLIHHSFISIADQVDRNNHYSSLGTSHLAQEDTRFSLSKLIVKPIAKFLETFVWKRGFLDGLLGLIISVSAAYAVFLKWAKLWELGQGEAKK